MFVKTKERSGRTTYYLCIPEGGGSGWKAVEYSVCLGETLELTAERWFELLHGSSVFRNIPLANVLEVLEKYVREHELPPKTLAGLREAAHASKRHKARRDASGDRRGQENQRIAALRVLGLGPGSSDDEIEKAFRKAARRYHPDVGGDSEKFQEILGARNFLLGRSWHSGETA